jgi:hypothetical protein
LGVLMQIQLQMHPEKSHPNDYYRQ